MAESTPNQSEPAENKNADVPKAATGLPPKSPPPPGAGGPPKSPPPPGAGGPPKSPPPPGAGAPVRAPAPPTAGGPPKAPAPPGAGGPPKAPAPPAAGGPPKTPAPPTAAAPAKAPPPVVASISNADNPLGQVPRPPKPGAPAPAGAPKAATTTAAGTPAVAAVAPESTVTRREFLNYVWGASMALFLVQFGGLSFFFALPRARLGEFGGIIPVGVQQFLDAASQKAPIANNAGKFWIINTEQGINALYKVCTHLGCIYPWSDAANRFACPCHGSQFQLNGDYIAGPAPRSLDRFQFQIQDASGAVIGAGTDGLAVPLPANAATILVDTGKKVTGKSHL